MVEEQRHGHTAGRTAHKVEREKPFKHGTEGGNRAKERSRDRDKARQTSEEGDRSDSERRAKGKREREGAYA